MNTDNLKKEIKRVKVWHIVVLCTGIFLAFAIIGSILLAMSGFSGAIRDGFNWNLLENIGPGETYDVDDYEEVDMDGVDKIVINTISDDVILTGDGAKITARLKGQCRSTNKPVYLETHRDGDTVYIDVKYPKFTNSSTTDLTVTVPEAYAGDLSIHTVSGDVEAEGLPFKLQKTEVDTISGSVHFGTASCERMSVNTVSGNVDLSEIVAETDVSTTSGEIMLAYASFAETNANTVSGEVTALIPENAAFAVDFDSVSGDFRSNHPAMNADSSDSYRGSANGGDMTIKVRTTSGNFDIDAK